MIVIVALQFAGCDSTKPPRTGTSKAAYTLPDQFIFEAFAERGADARIFLTGRTNLPDGLRIGAEVAMGKYRMTNDGRPVLSPRIFIFLFQTANFAPLDSWLGKSPYHQARLTCIF
jgi:hypothetical protein